MSLSGVTAAQLIVNDNTSIALALLAGIGVALIIGIINGFVVVVMRIDSFIGTLATGSLVQAFISFVTGDNTINSVKLSGAFSTISQGEFLGVTYPVYYMLALAIILWLFMEHTATGRRLYATGFNPDAARLANIKVNRLRFCSLLTSAGIAGFTGVMLASSIGSGDPSAGTPYLLPAFATLFVGATVFKQGRFNAWGTIVAIIMLGTGTVGLGLVAAPLWASDMFTGVVLIAALGASVYQSRSPLRNQTGRARWLPFRQRSST
jgi:ribose transport system permease protein